MNLYRCLDRSKVQFDFVKHTHNKCAYEEEILSLGGRIYTAPRFMGINLIQYQNWWKKHILRHPEHNIIHGHYFTVSKYYFDICKKMGRTTIGHSHTDTYTWKNIEKLIMIRNLEYFCDYRLACSEKAGKMLYPHKDYTVLKNAIDVTKYLYNQRAEQEVRDEFNLGESPIIGVIGTIKDVKNPLASVEILKNVLEERPEVKMLWIGADGGMKNDVVHKLYEYGCCDNVVFTGVRSDVNRLLQAINVYIMPSLKEGLPVAGIEAQAAGITCIFSDTVSEDVAITDCCYFLPLSDMEVWAKSCLEAFNKPRKDTQAAIREAGFDVHTTAKWIQDFYEGLAKDG
jgi:glycosyltransferase involved in cell wall biosynthesis